MALSEEKLRQLPPKAQEFWRNAQNFVQTNQCEWAWIEAGTDQFVSWVKYFQWKNWEPYAIRAIRKGTIRGMTMPTELPEWFDKDFAVAAAK